MYSSENSAQQSITSVTRKEKHINKLGQRRGLVLFVVRLVIHREVPKLQPHQDRHRPAKIDAQGRVSVAPKRCEGKEDAVCAER